ncbi:hypothetical protein QBC38DRAFT_374671 [Podospora fimiseda]|uniref:Uncharacterized protein n=1 Tax=Podospora fimiseda TaxID=252190 RepID=A0AAN6YTP5_9PEZI|nr:hypothetical protein QBC38DRAFT_374671 [Podospora fimiseda]
MAGSASIGASCQEGGSFYFCQNSPTEFIGCCTSAAAGKCPLSNLRNTTFSPANYDNIGPQRCENDDKRNWYTCTYENLGKAPFMGCCLINPCELLSCPADKLLPARLSDKPEYPASTSTTSTETTSSTTSPADAPSKSNGLSKGAIIGIAVGIGAACFLALIIFCIIRFRRKAKWNNTGSTAEQRPYTVSGQQHSEYKSVPAFSPSQSK